MSSDRKGQIEVTVPLKAYVATARWIDKAEWDGLSETEQKAKIDEWSDAVWQAVNSSIERDGATLFGEGVYMEIIEPMVDEVSYYDPEKEG